RTRAQIIEPPKYDRFSRTNFGARRCEAALLPVVAEGAFECAAGVGQRLRAAVNHAKRTGDDAIPAAIADVVLHKHRADFGANDCSRGTGFKTTRSLAVLANIREKDPAKRIFRLRRGSGGQVSAATH